MWTYEIRKRRLLENGKEKATGYSGFNEYANDPSKVREKGKGPIPPGKYRFAKAIEHPHLGPCAMYLDPLPGTDTFGRGEFFIHGDNSTPAPFDASHGCIILDRHTRNAMNASQDRVLEVIP